MTPDPPRIERLRERLVYANDYVEVYDDEVRRDGRPATHLRIVEAGGRPGVAVVPLHAGRVALVRQHRYPVGRALLEVPRGFAESDDPAADAARELREETGITASELVPLGVLHANSGLLAGAVHAFAAVLDAAAVAGAGPGDEVDELRWCDHDRLRAAVRDGELTDGITLGCLLKASVAGLLER